MFPVGRVSALKLMKKSVTFLAPVLLFTSAGARAQQLSNPSTSKEQIHAVLCAVDQKNYEAAQKTLEQLLASDPKNTNYQKAFLGVQARQVKRDDHSARFHAASGKTE